ncbi:hypothetical protein JF535_13385 [Microbulbifer salipaludis]|uniref:Uncharacterized protein n=1 Tax=Microbulbifer salipaludis TaxID=187980 RepID=A0ABS3E957_9GAMM|nr:hypothetical protein [Microbulbifer salipaludis]MBN8431845.1 hypothetical protein [Microbulbifer salipaludis]
MAKLTEEQLQAKIDALPREHEPRQYSVTISDKRGNYLATRIVRASSRERARLVGFKVNYYVFGQKNSFDACASLVPPPAAPSWKLGHAA